MITSIFIVLSICALFWADHIWEKRKEEAKKPTYRKYLEKEDKAQD